MKPVKQLVVRGGSVVVGETMAMPDTTVNSSLHVQQALIRHALAYEFLGLISFHVSQRYIDTLFRHMTREAPSGYRQVTLRQVFWQSWQSSDLRSDKPPGNRPDHGAFYLFPLATPEKPFKQWKESPILIGNFRQKGDRRQRDRNR